MTDEGPLRTSSQAPVQATGRRPTPRTPRWVVVFAIAFVVVVILLGAVQHLVFGGHGGHTG